MKRTVMVIVLLISLIGSIWGPAMASEESKANEQTALKNKGVVFFAPIDTDPHDDILKMNNVGGAEIFLTWTEVVNEEGNYDWSILEDLIARYEAVGKDLSIRIAIANGRPTEMPAWLYNDYNVRRLITGEWCNFEKNHDGYELGVGAELTEAEDLVISESRSLYAKGQTDGFNEIAATAASVMLARDIYSIQFDYRAVDDVTLVVKHIWDDGTEKELAIIEIPAGTVTSEVMDFIPEAKNGRIVIGQLGKTEVVIDNINIAEIEDNGWFGSNMGMPNFFDPVFKEKYVEFVEAFADKYDGHPVVSSVAVGGFGRWEEMTLDPHDPNGFEDQLLAFGYNDEDWYQHIKWCIDLYDEKFKQTKLTLCPYGHGDFRFTDEELTNWTFAGYAAHKGMLIKYNGWQEVASHWGQNTHFTNQFARYRYDDQVETAYEEGGQITRNHYDLMGHPLSMMNKALIDNVDYLWIYSIDILDRNISRYFHYVNEQAGNTLNTRFYAKFGKHSLLSNYDFKTYDFYNMWYGLFLSNDWNRLIPEDPKNKKLDYTEIDGEKCVGTTPNEGYFQFSLNDQQKYLGLYGSTMTIEYYDQGTDSFNLEVYYEDERRWETVGEVTKTGSDTWKTAEFYIPDSWGNFKRSHGRSTLNDFRIQDMSDGVEYIRSVELDTVTARDWATERAIDAERTDAYRTVDGSMEMILNLKHTDDVYGISVPLAVKDFFKNKASMEVYQMTGDQWELLGHKEHYMPADGDWMYVPFIPSNSDGKYKIVVNAERGNIGWYENEDGKPAVRVDRYVPQVMDFDLSAAKERRLVNSFYGLNLTGDSGTAYTVTVDKKVGDGYVTVASGEGVLGEDGKDRFNFEPQTRGIYRVDANGCDQTAQIVWLQRRRESYPAKSNSVGDVLHYWDMSQKPADWNVIESGNDIIYTEEGMVIDLNKEPQALEVNGLEIGGKATDNIEVVLKNETSASLMRVYWMSGDDTDYSAKKSAFIPVVPNDDRYRQYSYQVGLEKKWSEMITAVKIEPVASSSVIGRVSISALGLTRGIAYNQTYGDLYQMSYKDALVTEPLTEAETAEEDAVVEDPESQEASEGSEAVKAGGLSVLEWVLIIALLGGAVAFLTVSVFGSKKK